MSDTVKVQIDGVVVAEYHRLNFDLIHAIADMPQRQSRLPAGSPPVDPECHLALRRYRSAAHRWHAHKIETGLIPHDHPLTFAF